MKFVESQIQQAVVQWARLMKSTYPELRLLHAIPNGARTGARRGAILKREGILSGMPDLFLPCARHDFHGLYLEAKAPNGQLSPQQKEVHALLQEQLFAVKVFRSVEEGIALLKWWVA